MVSSCILNIGCFNNAPILIFSAHISEKSFVYNRTFAESTSTETDAAWESIFPPHGGFFHHQTLAPVGGSLAVYHQLHCLVGKSSQSKRRDF